MPVKIYRFTAPVFEPRTVRSQALTLT